ncbi:MAG: O-methyltransferase [Bacteroidales bacterium]
MQSQDAKIIRAFKQDIRQIQNFSALDLGTKQNRSLNGKSLLKMGIDSRYGTKLYGLCRYFRPQHIVELGTSAGLSTAYLAVAYPKAQIITIEGCPGKANIAKQLFQKHQLHNITVVNDEATNYINQLNSCNYKADLVFIDADHSYSGTLDFYNLLKNITTHNSVLIFDDIYWSRGMKKAWKSIIQDKHVSVSLATMRFGLVFFKKNIARQHFNLRM